MLNPDNETLEWCAKWIEDSLRAETNERTIEFGNNMAMTIRAVKTKQPAAISDSARRAAEEWKDAGGDVWEIRRNVDCVECPHCGFTFAAVHTDGYSNGYSCPNCEGCPDAAAPVDNDAERGEEESGYPNLRDGEMPLG